MKKLAFLFAILSLSACVSTNGITKVDPKGWWGERSEGEKIIIGGGAAMIVTGLIIRNGQGNSQEQCISTRSLETGLPEVNKYGSRKFIVTLIGMSLTAGLALMGSMSGDVALVMTAAIGGYQLANSYVTGAGKGDS